MQIGDESLKTLEAEFMEKADARERQLLEQLSRALIIDPTASDTSAIIEGVKGTAD